MCICKLLTVNVPKGDLSCFVYPFHKPDKNKETITIKLSLLLNCEIIDVVCQRPSVGLGYFGLSRKPQRVI